MRPSTMAPRKKTDEPQIRAATMADIDSLVRLENRVFTSYYEKHRFDAADYRYYLRDRRTIARVAVRGGVLVGYVLGVVHTGRLRHLARLHSVAVVRNLRRRGVGEHLMRVFLRAVKKRKCKRVLLEIATANKGSLEFFQGLGFKNLRTLNGYYGKGIDGVRMSVDL